MNWRDFLNFRRMITPVIIKILFWVGVGSSVLAGIGVFFGGIIGGIADGEFGAAIGGLIGGPIVILLGVVITRIYCELLILFFQINDTLTDIRNLLQRQ